MSALVKKILDLPRRVEPLGGQSFSYVKLDDVLALVEAQSDGWDVETVKRQVKDFNALCDAARGYRERAEKAEAALAAQVSCR